MPTIYLQQFCGYILGADITYVAPPFPLSRNMVNCNHLLMSMFIMIFALSNCVQCGLRRVQKILATNSYITRFQTKLSRYRRADRPQLQILLSHVESQKPVKTVAAMYIQRLLPGSTFPISVISILLVFVMEHR